MVTYKNSISASEVNAIRKKMGWRQELPEQLQASIEGSSFVIAANVIDSELHIFRFYDIMYNEVVPVMRFLI